MKRHFKMESDTDSTTSQSSGGPRLGKCEVCDDKDAKYTCPKCEVKTCCLQCLQIHKKELNCSGIRDKTKYIPLNKMTKMDFFSDYNFLEECTRYVEARKRDNIKKFTRYNKSLPSKLFKLRNAANNRKTTLRFLLPNFTKHKANTTYLDLNTQVIYWRIEWIFTNAGNLKFVDEKCCENDSISKLLDKYLNPANTEDVKIKKYLEYYQSKGIGNLQILLKAEGIKRCKNRFYMLDCKKTLKENLEDKTVVEFPCIHICYDIVDDYDIIDSDEDILEETREHKESINDFYSKKSKEEKARKIEPKPEDIQKKLEKLLIEKKREERRKKREEFEKEPMNLLFSNERLLDILSSDSEGNETEEEVA